MEDIAVNTGLRQYTVAEGITTTFADRLGDTRLYIVFYREVQDVLNAIIAGSIFHGLYITIGLVELMVTPSIRQLATAYRSGLFVRNYL